MSKIENSVILIPSLYVTIIRSFRWKSFDQFDMSKFPASSVFFDIKRKHHCKAPQTIAKHLLGEEYFLDGKKRRKVGKVMSSVQFYKSLQFLRYNQNIDNDDFNSVLFHLADWLVSRTPDYEKAKWNF